MKPLIQTMTETLIIRFFQAVFCLVLIFVSVFYPSSLDAQTKLSPLYKVLTLTGQAPTSIDIPQDHGLAGVWQSLLKLQTTGSILHTQAHPDDEDAGLLTYLSRGKGIRTALLSLTRGEGGSNVIGTESFDQLGMLRTEEFRVAAHYYGLDDLYFTNLADYGFSKRVDEAYEKWGRENVLREMVRIIRINRPFIIISRFSGTSQDGHGNHQAAGEISPEAYEMAGDAKAFPEQITKEGLRPWKAFKFYRGAIADSNHPTLSINTGAYCSWLGESYANFALLGYSFHRSQFGGQLSPVQGDSKQQYTRLSSRVSNKDTETTFFDGIDTTISGLLNTTGETGPEGIVEILSAIERSVHNTIAAFKPNNENALISSLTIGLNETRKAILLLNGKPEAQFLLKIKEQQFMDAINALLAVDLQAMAIPEKSNEHRSFYEPPPTMGFAVPGQPFKIDVTLINRSQFPITNIDINVSGFEKEPIKIPLVKQPILVQNQKMENYIHLRLPDTATLSIPYYHRASLNESKYQSDNERLANLPGNESALFVIASYRINGEQVIIRQPVKVRQVNMPYGFEKFNLKIVPAIAINVKPTTGIIVTNKAGKVFNFQVDFQSNKDTATKGILKLILPAGWKAIPESVDFNFAKAGEINHLNFKIITNTIETKLYQIKVVAVSNGDIYSRGYLTSVHRDLDQTLFFQEATSQLKGIDVSITSGLSIGYIMGAGDEVPAAIEELGAQVHLLNSQDLATMPLTNFDAIMIGTRAYAVRQDLITHNDRLLQYAKSGGNLIVLFQTPEFVPTNMAPYPAQLPGNSEEISEEDSPVTILAKKHRQLNFPNKILPADFDGWLEQRGSKFFASWDSAYIPMIVTNDKGQLPQRGGWLTAKFGKGSYTYFAYALHRQLPNGVAGAYKLLANLLSYGNRKLAIKH